MSILLCLEAIWVLSTCTLVDVYGRYFVLNTLVDLNSRYFHTPQAWSCLNSNMEIKVPTGIWRVCVPLGENVSYCIYLLFFWHIFSKTSSKCTIYCIIRYYLDAVLIILINPLPTQYSTHMHDTHRALDGTQELHIYHIHYMSNLVNNTYSYECKIVQETIASAVHGLLFPCWLCPPVAIQVPRHNRASCLIVWSRCSLILFDWHCSPGRPDD